MHSGGRVAWNLLGVGEAALSRVDGVLVRREQAAEAPGRRIAYGLQADV
jgi:hypothetical protein